MSLKISVILLRALFERTILFSFVLLSVLELSYGNDHKKIGIGLRAEPFSICFLELGFI